MQDYGDNHCPSRPPPYSSTPFLASYSEWRISLAKDMIDRIPKVGVSTVMEPGELPNGWGCTNSRETEYSVLYKAGMVFTSRRG